LRRNQTDAENHLWYYLRSRRLNGVKFRRQVPIGQYIVDFVSFDKKLIIELDGGQHGEEPNMKRDKMETQYFESEEYKIPRFWDNDILNNIDGVVTIILDNIK